MIGSLYVYSCCSSLYELPAPYGPCLVIYSRYVLFLSRELFRLLMEQCCNSSKACCNSGKVNNVVSLCT